MTTIDRTIAPEPGPPRPYHFPRVERRTLDNGLRLLVAENHNAPLVSMRTLFHSGADYDTAELAGLASLTGELLDEGAGSRDAVRLAEDLGLLGASLGSGADWDASYISVDSLSRTFDESLAIFADVNRRPMLPEASLDRVRSERLMELLQQRDDAGAIAGKRFSRLIYGGGTYGNTVIGNPDSVARIAADDVRRYYATHYAPNNGSIVIAGDVALRHTRYLRQVYYIGANEGAAKLSGILVNRVRIFAYALTGFLASLAGLLLSSRLQAGTPTAGNGLELQVLAAAVIGGARLGGGAGTVFGAFLGVVFVGLINNAMTMLQVSVLWQIVVAGIILIVAVALDTLLRRISR